MISIITDRGKNTNNIRSQRWKEILVLFLFVFTYIVITIFHEPWFDEAQAWQIAKYCSINEIIFTVGHYEGHPFLWYLILAIPAKIGIPFEFGIKTIGLIVSSIAAAIIILKSPFPMLIRCLVPFSYFFFYQHGIIVRQYGLLLLLVLLCAVFFQEKDNHPWYLTIPMILMCSLSAYGVVISGGIAVCWVIDIISDYKGNADYKEIVHDSRFLPLTVLLFFAFFIIFCIIPVDDTYSAASDAINSPIVCLIVAMLTFLGDAFMTTSPIFSVDTYLLQTVEIEYASVIAAGLVSIVLSLMLLCFSSEKKLKYLVIPTIFFYLFSSFVYFTVHHLGILASYILFWCWINLKDNHCFAVGNYLFEKLGGTVQDKKKLKIVGIGILTFCTIVNLYWTVSASLLDVKYEYNCGRGTAAFLKETGLDQLKIASYWLEYPIEEGEERGPENINTVLNGINTLILSYFDHNIIYTFNGGEDIGYSQYRKLDPIENTVNIHKAKQQGIPDVLIGTVNLELLTDGAVTLDDYAPVYQMKINQIFKADYVSDSDYIYLRRDLLDQYSVQELEVKETTFVVTDEVRERFENGESMESILEPFFEQLFS